MSIKLMSAIFDTDLPTTEKFVLIALADYAADDGESVYPSLDTVRKKTSLSVRAVQIATKSLEEKGYLELRKRGGGRTSNRWRIVVEKVFEGRTTFTPEVQYVHPSGEVDSPDPVVNQYPTKGETPPSYQVKSDAKVDLFPIANAIAEVTGLSLKVSKGRIFKAAKELSADPEITAALILRLYSPGGAWYKENWIGKRGEKPAVNQIAETIYTLERNGGNKEPGKIRVVKEKGGIPGARTLEQLEREGAI